MMLVREFREAWRRLSKRPGYALLSVAVLGVGLGVTLFFFGMVNTVILQPYPFPQANRLMSIGEPLSNGIGDIDSAQYLQLQGKLKSVDAMGAYTYVRVNLDRGTGATSYIAGRMTASLMPMLGAKPLLGRDLVATDDAPGAPRVVLLGESLWRHAFHADPHIIGQTVKVNGAWATVVGVLPASFAFPPVASLWLPLRLEAAQHSSIRAIARLAPGVQLSQARAELDTWAGPLQRALPPDMQMKPLVVEPMSYSFTPTDLRHWVWLIFGAGLLVLLLACINVANLQLVQTLKRRHELALRSALGSSRTRLVTGALAESLLLGMAALVPAFAITWCATHWIDATWLAVHPSTIPYQHGIDGWVIAFGVLIAVLSTALAGGIPAWRAGRANLGDALRDGSKGSGGGFARVTKTLVIAEVALTVVLLVGAGSFVRALEHLLTQPAVGATHAAQVLTAQVSLPATEYRKDAQRIHFFDAVVEHLRHDPGVIDATASDTVPSAVLGSHEYVSLPGHPKPAQGWPQVQMGIVGPHFLDTYGVRLLEGRFFGASDRADSEPTVVIDAKMAAAMWPHEDALGRKLVLWPGRPQARTLTVVGVVQTMQLDSGLETPLPGMLLPLDQTASQAPLHDVGLAVRVHANASSYTRHLAAAVHAVDPRAAIYDIRTQARSTAASRVGLTVLTDVFAAVGVVALLLAAAGLYGVLAFSVAQRTREIGIRRAIGADNGAIVREVGRQLLWQLGLGLVIGVALAVPWSAMLANPGLGTRAHDPTVFVPVLLVVIGVSMLAALVPLIRALRVDPAVALRYE
ncbi:MAG: ADOP family duplicated permease [Rhodanobacteraceae bacterium]